MNYFEFHNHKWAVNLAHARKLFDQGQFEKLYRGEDLPDGDVFAGLRVISAYWISVEHEMPLRYKTLLRGSGHPEWAEDAQLIAKADEYLARFEADMKELVVREHIITARHLDTLFARDIATPADWAIKLRSWQTQGEEALAAGVFPLALFENFLDSCLRSIANYNRFLIWGAVIAANLVKQGGPAALNAAVDATSEDFMWDVSKEFFGNVLPQAGFEDIGDLMELGLRGMFADQWYVSGEERSEGDSTIKTSVLKNCELAGVFRKVALWEGLPELSLGYAICRYCEVHGLATMMISMPPMVSPSYRRLQSQGMDGVECRFELTTVPADDMPRILMVQEKIFGSVEE